MMLGPRNIWSLLRSGTSTHISYLNEFRWSTALVWTASGIKHR